MLILSNSSISDSFSQTPSENLQKYWNYRQRLRDKFIVVDANNGEGTNIPATARGETRWDRAGEIFIDWGDGNANLDHYFSVLATEYRLLKDNKQDYTVTIQELLYAIRAFNRLDYTAETKFKDAYNNDGAPVYNGFFIRDDVTKTFFKNNKTHFNIPNFSSTLFPDGDGNEEESKMRPKEMSQDNVWNLMVGLSLVIGLVDDEVVDGQTVLFRAMAQNIVYRIVTQMQHVNPVINPYLFALFSETYPSANFLHIYAKNFWYIKNPVTHKFVEEGSGDDWDNEFFFSYGFAEAGDFLLGIPQNDGRTLHYQNSLLRQIHFMQAYDNASGKIMLDIPFTDKDYEIAHYNPYPYRALTTIAGMDSWERDIYIDLISKRRESIDYKPFEHFPLIYVLLHNRGNFDFNSYNYILDIYEPWKLLFKSFYNMEKTYYENLLNKAPCDGPHGSSFNSCTYNQLWSNDSRLQWPEKLNEKPNAEFAGLDYMLLHNLYFLVFKQPNYYKTKTDITAPLTASGTVSDPYQVSDLDITANSKISGNSNVSLTACRSIELLPGFEVEEGSTFVAGVNTGDDCVNFPYKKLAPAPCPPCNERVARNEVPTQTAKQTVPEKNPKEINKKENFTNQKLNTPQVRDDSNITIYPQPNNGNFLVFLGEQDNEISKIQIQDVLGKIIFQESAITANILRFNISDYPPSVYLLRIITKERVFTEKIIKKE